MTRLLRFMLHDSQKNMLHRNAIMRFCVVIGMLVFHLQLLSQSIRYGFEINDDASYWSNTSVISNETAFEGIRFGRASAQHLYSHGLEIPIDDSLQGKNLQLNFSGYFRSEKLPVNAIYVITIVCGDSLLFWHGVKLNEKLSEPDKWFQLTTMFLLPKNHTSNSSLKSYLWNPSQEQIDLDALSIGIEPFAIPSYIPPFTIQTAAGYPNTLFQNKFYSLLYYPQSKSLLIADKDNIPLTHPLAWYTEVMDRKTNVSITTSRWEIKQQSAHDNTQTLQFVSTDKWSENTITLTSHKYSSEIQFSIETHFIKKIQVYRQSLVLQYIDEPDRIFRKNSLIDSLQFQDEYYLDYGGVSIGKNQRTLQFYHTTKLSSVQLNTKQKRIVFNTDFLADHRMIHFPLKKSDSNIFEDWSAIGRKKGNKLNTTFWLYFGRPTHANVPRFMPVPRGFEAAIVWTEHADWADIRTHRAVHFGSENIAHFSKATSGFSGYDIPITKSVFFHNPDSISNTEIGDGSFKQMHATIQTDTAFLGLLLQLKEIGNEICLHTPEQYTSNQQSLKQSLEWMQKTFGSPTWIDHGYGNAKTNNRENISCDGLLPKSPQYAAGLWKAYGVRYFWNPYFEEAGTFNRFAFNGNMLIPYPGFGDAFPDRIFSRQRQKLDGILWSTTGTLEVAPDKDWGYFFHQNKLADLVKHRSIWINHIYPAWVNPEKGFWIYDTKGEIVAHPKFNEALQRIANLRDANLLLPLTVRDMLSYYEALLQIEYRFMDDGNVSIINRGSSAIIGLSMAIANSNVTVNNSVPLHRISGNDIIFWFNLNAGEEAKIAILPRN